MAPVGKADRKAALDIASWMFNVVTSVAIIMANKALMATYGFSFGRNIFMFCFFLTVSLMYLHTSFDIYSFSVCA